MTKSYGCTFLAAAQRRSASAPDKLGLQAMICVVVLFCTAAVIAAPAQSVFFTTLVSFNGSNGNLPSAPVIQATDGNLYGTTRWGGDNCGSDGCGIVFKITPGGNLSTLYSFCLLPNCADGRAPWAPVVQAADGNFYGTTDGGGTYSLGTVFKITAAGTLTTLYSFCALGYPCPDGYGPDTGLIQGVDGNFYGITGDGGSSNYCVGPNCGTVFKITPQGALTTLYSFCSQSGCPDGAYPIAALVQSSDGTLYGTTYFGGANSGCINDENGCGTVFKITLDGTLTTLYSFCSQSGCTDGAYPYAGLVQGTDGNFYGTTAGGGTMDCDPFPCGTVFKITPAGVLTTLYVFHGTDGAVPYGGLVQATDGDFYGTTFSGGTHSGGTVFKITPAGTLTTLHNFCAKLWPCADGNGPEAGLVQATNGFFYGTTTAGGGDDYGTVFRIGLPRSCATCRP